MALQTCTLKTGCWLSAADAFILLLGIAPRCRVVVLPPLLRHLEQLWEEAGALGGKAKCRPLSLVFTLCPARGQSVQVLTPFNRKWCLLVVE